MHNGTTEAPTNPGEGQLPFKEEKEKAEKKIAKEKELLKQLSEKYQNV